MSGLNLMKTIVQDEEDFASEGFYEAAIATLWD
jgi:hypothetical protein